MRVAVLLSCAFVVCLCAGCASSHEATRETKRPNVYLGGQYYGDALHAEDLATNDKHFQKGIRN
jgi:hypothetical protein